MNKEVPLKDRIEKLYESGYVNEFNYLESQLQEARYLVSILHKQTEEKDKEIERLNNIINKFDNYLLTELVNCPIEVHKIYQDTYKQFKELKEGK